MFSARSAEAIEDGDDSSDEPSSYDPVFRKNDPIAGCQSTVQKAELSLFTNRHSILTRQDSLRDDSFKLMA